MNDDDNLHAAERELRWLRATCDRLAEACRALPLERFPDGETPDAADFKDNSAAFLRAMGLARNALAEYEGEDSE